MYVATHNLRYKFLIDYNQLTIFHFEADFSMPCNCTCVSCFDVENTARQQMAIS